MQCLWGIPRLNLHCLLKENLSPIRHLVDKVDRGPGDLHAPGKDGLVHISKLARTRVEKVEDVVTVGDMIWVKFMEIDEKGRWNLSRKDALIEIEAQQAAAKAAEQQ